MPCLQYICSKQPAQVSIERNNDKSRDSSDSAVRMEGKEEWEGMRECNEKGLSTLSVLLI